MYSGDPLDNVPVEAYTAIRSERDRFGAALMEIAKDTEGVVPGDAHAHFAQMVLDGRWGGPS